MKYKVDDVLASEYNELLYLYKVIGHDSFNYLVTCVDHDSPSGELGKEISAPIAAVDRADHVSLAFNRIDGWKLPGGETLEIENSKTFKIDKRHSCICDKFQVIHLGCKCGGC